MNYDEVPINPTIEKSEETSATLESIDSAETQPISEEDNGPVSSIENIIPVEKLRKGWLAISDFLTETAAEARKKAEDAYNSEQFMSVRQKTNEIVTPVVQRTNEIVQPAWQRTTEIVAPAWEKTKEAAAPIWEKTKSTAEIAYEKTKEGVNAAAEQLRPTVEHLSKEISEAANEGWKSVSDQVSSFSQQFSATTPEREEEYPASAMDSAARGGPMTL